MNIQKKKGKKKSPRNPTHYELCGCRTRGLVTPCPPARHTASSLFSSFLEGIPERTDISGSSDGDSFWRGWGWVNSCLMQDIFFFLNERSFNCSSPCKKSWTTRCTFMHSFDNGDIRVHACVTVRASVRLRQNITHNNLEFFATALLTGGVGGRDFFSNYCCFLLFSSPSLFFFF